MEDFVQQQALSVIDKPVTEVQNIAAGILREQSQSPGVDRALVRELRQFLKQPLVGVGVQRLREALRQYGNDNNYDAFLAALRDLHAQVAYYHGEERANSKRIRLTREQLHLVCYEYIVA